MKWESQADPLSRRLYLVNHQHYKPVLHAFWEREKRETETKSAKRLAQTIQTGEDKKETAPKKGTSGITFSNI